MKKDKADLVSKSLLNIQSQIAIYETIIDKLRDEIGILITKVEEQQQTIQHLEKQVTDMVNKKSRAKVE
jgi:flagellar biosynthesis chaperone FliJ